MAAARTVDKNETRFSDSADDRDDDHDQDEAEGDDEEEDEEEEGDETDRGDDHEGTDDDDQEPESDEDEEEESDETLDPEALERIANGGEGDMVPRARLNEVLNREEKLLAALIGRGGVPAKEEKPEPEFDVKAAMREYNDKMMEGDADAAFAILEKLNAHNLSVAEVRAFERISATLEQERVNDAITEVQAAYPVLNDGDRKFSQDTLDEVIALRNVFMGRGERMSDALRKAAKRICGDRDTPATPAADKKPKQGSGKPEQRNQRTPEQLRQAARIAAKQPPRTANAGAGERRTSGGLDVKEMSPERFKALTPAEKAKLRGDTL